MRQLIYTESAANDVFQLTFIKSFLFKQHFVGGRSAQDRVRKDESSATVDHATGQDGKKCLRENKIPKKTRTSKYNYRESPYEEHSSEEDCISGSEAEDGIIMKPKSRRSDYAKSGVSDDESDCERFDPLDKESELFMTGSMARYVQKYFSTYVSESCLKEKVLGDSSVPSNAKLSPPSIDSGDRRVH
ncbi:unnamed protein product [Mytilus coruscus]|uniref:Uncharacterized protein n=1 Tax=Mytilus coruscus TaxID=42192 RepID=A0A6J8E5B1_MYTCO|nr:unnamed protein product [Mytilus coruscus]